MCVLHVHYQAKLLSVYPLHRGIQHVWAFRGDGGQHLSLTFDLTSNPPLPHSSLVWPGSSLGRSQRMKGPEMPSQYTISTNEHFEMIFVLNWVFFFVPISSISASQHQGEIQGCPLRDSLSQQLLLIYSPRLPPAYFISCWVKLSQPCNPLSTTRWRTHTERRLCVCVCDGVGGGIV